MNQRTLASEARVTGIGLHSGETCTAVFKPAPVGTGIVFVRTDLPGRPAIVSHPSRLCQRMRRTALAAQVDGVEVEVHTTEHFLAACQGLALDNVVVELDAVELPGLDGSAKDFVDCLKAAGLVDLPAVRAMYDVKEPVAVEVGKASIVALPYANGLKITYTLDDHGGALGGAQVVEVELGEDAFAREIAPARTFCMLKEVEALRAMGLGKGATPQNTCIYDGKRVIDTELRFPDEAARHKILDLIGDLAHCARRLNTHIVAVRTGHRENMLLVQELNRRIEADAKPAFRFDVRKVLELLPHRFPFLMIDRILDVEPGRFIVGQKCVSVNEPFFPGHFPGQPVMPGVLQLEALAQTGACLLMLDPANRGKVPFLMSIDKVRFRRPVIPGDVLRLEIDVLRIRPRMAACQGRVLVDGQLCCEAEIRSMLVEQDAADLPVG